MHADSSNSSFSTSDYRPASSPPLCSAFLSSSPSSPHSWPHRCSSGSTDGIARIPKALCLVLPAMERSLPQRPVTSPLLLAVTDGLEAFAHPSQRVVENLHLFTALFVGWLDCASGTFGLDSRRTLAAQQAEVLVACLPESALQVFQRLRVHAFQSVGMSLGDQRVFLRGQVHMVGAHL